MQDSIMIHGAGGIPDKSWKPQFGIIDTSYEFSNLHKINYYYYTYVLNYIFYTVTYICRMGQITIELYWDHAPETCRNFAELCRRGYYNNTKFHRIIRNFMIQGKILIPFKVLRYLINICLKLFGISISKQKQKSGRF